MKLELEEPFKSRWQRGYLVTNSENRKNVVLYNSEADRSSISYARYLLSVKHGRFLNSDEEADHIDDDKTNDDINNLQILTPYENKVKESANRIVLHTFICPGCNTSFSLTGRQLGQRKNREEPTCGKECGYKLLSIRNKRS